MNNRCDECGKTLPEEMLIPFADTIICINCKPLVVQRIREGVDGGQEKTWLEMLGFGKLTSLELVISSDIEYTLEPDESDQRVKEYLNVRGVSAINSDSGNMIAERGIILAAYLIGMLGTGLLVYLLTLH